jgi:hypothetical protein
MNMKKRKALMSVAAILGAAVLMTGCSSGQKPASLGTGSTGGTGAAAAGSGGSAGGTSPSSGASGSATSAAGGSGGGASAGGSTQPGGSASASSNVPLFGGGTATPGTVITTTVAGGINKVVAPVPSDPNASAALAAFQSYENISKEMAVKAAFDNSLADYADLNALALVNNNTTQIRSLGLAYKGTSSQKVTGTTVNMAASPLPIVKISACVDDSKWALYYVTGAKKGKPFSTSPAEAPFLSTFTVHRSAAGKWLVTDVTPVKGSKC